MTPLLRSKQEKGMREAAERADSKVANSRYLDSLASMQEPVVPKVKLDMRGMLRLAREKGVTIGQLSCEEKDRYIQYL